MKTLCTLAQFEQFAEPKNADQDTQTFGLSYNGVRYIIVKHAQVFTAFINRCPHLNIPLEWQEHHFLDADTQLLRCSTHGALFMPSSGECVSGPCAGDSLQAVSISLINDSIVLPEN